jgi:ectoine hydroxylase-related dioxygenase (phytanoyl-CoA dioxygenase family)
MRVDAARLYHDQALFKEPGGGHTPWHQDQFYWPLDADRTITMWMPLVDVSEVMGSMTFANTSQNDGFVPVSDEISDASEEYFDEWVQEHGYSCPTSGAMTAGDATFHSGYTLHRAPGNVTDRIRAIMTMIYFPDGTRVTEPANPFQANDLKAWLAPRQPGELADGPLNPKV